MIHTVALQETQGQLLELLALTLKGDEVVITENDKPVARLVPAEAESVDDAPPRKRIAGLNRGSIWVSDDFDEPLPDEFWLGQE
jgi:prevent-host-death family protein